MKSTGRVSLIVFALLVAALAGGFLWLARAPVMPATQTVQQAIPDDRIPR